jgi:radical SAM protein with 4Fe4S-binding SPASM domain
MVPELKMVEIEINHHCNRACVYCPNSVTERKSKGEMDPELFEKLMNQLVDMKYKGSISYEFYNEPMLAKNLYWFVETTRKHLPTNRIDFYTNGTLLDRKSFDRLMGLGVSRFIVTKHKGEGKYVFDETFSSLTEAEKAKVIYQDHRELKLTNRGGAVDAGPKGNFDLAPCLIPSFLVTITVLGNVLPCFEDYHEEMVMGNIGDQHLRTIWANEKFQKLRKNLAFGRRHAHSPCDKCNRTYGKDLNGSKKD